MGSFLLTMRLSQNLLVVWQPTSAMRGSNSQTTRKVNREHASLMILLERLFGMENHPFV